MLNASIEVGRPNDSVEYTVRHQGNCILIFGSIPILFMEALSKAAPKRSVLAPRLAQISGATIAIGPIDAVNALSRKLAPAAIERARHLYNRYDLSESEITWLAIGERGSSSNAIFQATIGVLLPELSDATAHPHDPDDLRRCMLLFDQCPSVAANFEHMRKVSTAWNELVERWPIICDTFMREAPNWREPDAKWRAPQTFKLIKAAVGE